MVKSGMWLSQRQVRWLIVLLALLPLIPGILMMQMMVQNSLRDRSALEEGLATIYRAQLGITSERFSLSRELTDRAILRNYLERVFGSKVRVTPAGGNDGLAEAVAESAHIPPVIHLIQEGAYEGWSVQLVDGVEMPAYLDEQEQEIWWHGALILSAVLIVAAGVWFTVHRRLRIDELKADLLTNISHEIKTPVAASRIILETLEDGKINPEVAADYHELLRRENDRIGELANHFLIHGRLEKGQLSVSPEPCDLAVLVADEIDLIMPRVEAVSGTLTLKVESDCRVRTDPSAARTVVSNLLDNAVKYGGEPPSVEVVIHTQDRFAEVSISDRGKGIPRSERRAVFRRFYRGDGALSRSRGGVGLGLPICRHLMRLLKGDIRVQSGTGGTGADFRIRLPLVS